MTTPSKALSLLPAAQLPVSGAVKLVSVQGGVDVLMTLSDALGLYATVASPTFTGDPKAPTPTPGDNDTSIATTAFVTAALAALLASPALSGAPTTTTAPDADSSTRIANTLWVQQLLNGTVSVSVAGGADVTLTASQYGRGVITLTGAITANINVIFPTSGQWKVINSTSGAFGITCKTAAGSGVAVTQGKANILLADGTNIALAHTDFNSIALTGNSTATTQTAGDNSTKVATTAFVQGAAGATGHGQCYLSLSGGNLLLAPRDGNKLIVNGVVCTVPAAGVTLAPGGLTPGTQYYIYATASAGVINALEASTTGHSTQTNGVETKSGDAARTFVGIAFVAAGPSFQDSSSQRYLLSWFNRRPKAIEVNGATATTTSAVIVAASNSIDFLTWGDSATVIVFEGNGSVNTAGFAWGTAIFVDGAQVNTSMADHSSSASANLLGHFNRYYTNMLGEGHHTAALGINTGGGTSSYSYTQQGIVQG